MEKKNVKDKRLIKIYCIICFVMLCVVAMITSFEYKKYRENNNEVVFNMIEKVKEKYPEISDEEIADILKGSENVNSDFFDKHGISVDEDSLAEKNEKVFISFVIINVFVVFVYALIVLALIIHRNRSKNKEILQIAKYIEEINNKNYSLDIDDLSEDELSYLKNEIYKTTIMLKENAENSLYDKVELKKSLEDISHQIKTPLTSILVMLDNIIEDPDMDEEVRLDFAMDIKRNINNINFLIQVLLKLSKFDSNTIKFIRSDEKLGSIVNESVKNIESLCDLKNITLNISGDAEASFVCDRKWQIEAVTNIIKNCVEHSKDDSQIDISYRDSNVYSEISIRDYGEGISDKDLTHIFERFYKTATSKSDSFGIGLSLAKKIVESDNGTICVDRMDVGTKFTIKYFKF